MHMKLTRVFNSGKHIVQLIFTQQERMIMLENSIQLKKRSLFFVLILTVIIFGIFWRALGYDLVWDDKMYLTQNLLIRENYPLEAAFKFSYFEQQIGVEGIDNYYRPLLTLSFLLESKIWGIQPITLRAVNLIIFLLSLIFLYQFLKRQKGNGYFPELTILIFALFPLNIDNIIWIVGRSDLLLLLWGSLTLLFLERFVEKHHYTDMAASALFYLFGIFSKESFFVFFPIVLLIEYSKRKRISYLFHFINLLSTFFFFFVKLKVLHIPNLNFSLSSGLLKSSKLALAALGGYFRIIVFPFRYPMFLSSENIMTPFYFTMGILALIILAFLVSSLRKNKNLVIPAALITLFLGLYILLIFTDLYPYKFYSRYMMLPIFGLTWISVKSLTSLKEKTALGTAFFVLTAFIFSIVLNMGSYSSEISFWRRAQRSSPMDPFVLTQLAGSSMRNKDFFSAELYLNEALSLNMKKETAIYLSLHYSDIELRRADYEKMFRWLDSIEALGKNLKVRIAPFIRMQALLRSAQAYTFKGEVETAENLYKEILKYHTNLIESHKKLYDLYLGYNYWEKAKAVEKIIKARFPIAFREIDADNTLRQFQNYSTDEKISFYVHYGNYTEASRLIEALTQIDFNQKLRLLNICYFAGKETKACSQRIEEESSGKYELLNKVARFYLVELTRAREALPYLRKSLELNKEQPEIKRLLRNLETDYLGKLQEVWK